MNCDHDTIHRAIPLTSGTEVYLARRVPYFLAVLLAGAVPACADTSPPTPPPVAPWSLRMADSILARQPRGTMIEQKNPARSPPRPAAWSYSVSLAVYAIAQAGIQTHNVKYIQYARNYADSFLNDKGQIDPARYKPDTFKLDDIAPGRLMLLLYHVTRDDKYRNAAIELAAQFKEQPRTSDGGFWHKKIYPHQMWLDGIFMACPFLADAGATLQRLEFFDEAAKQIVTIAAHTRDSKTGLFFHGWDESHTEKWANPATGDSANLWGRADGWFAAGIVDTLDNLPADHPRRAELIAILKDFARSIVAAQDSQSHLWWQVLDQPGKPGNYLESSASCMFTYALAKAAKKGYIDRGYLDIAKNSYAAILSHFIQVDPATGLVTLTDTCLVAGLGGKPYRDGSYDYYVHERRGANDPKGMGPFILASLELE